MKIVFLDSYTINPGDLNFDSLSKLGDFVAYDRTDKSEVLERAHDADILIVNKTRLTESDFKALPHLKLVCVAATGYDNVDIESARKHNISVCNCKNYSSDSVAQMALSLILEAADSVGSYTVRNHEGDWARCADFCYTIKPRFELAGKNMCVVGFGNIGRKIAEVMHALQMRIFAVTSKTQAELPDYVTAIKLEEAFSSCDIISLNCPLNSSNAGFVNKALLKTAKSGLILLNTARGGLINEQDVAEALTSGYLGAYCTDVLSQEPPCSLNPIMNAPRTFITPHIAWNTFEARERIINILVGNITAFVNNKPQNVVN